MRVLSRRGAGARLHAALLAVCFAGVGAERAAAQASDAASTGIWQRDNLFGDWNGIRSWLNRYGISPSLSETAETLGDPSGGIHQGFVYDGRLDSALSVDLSQAVCWTGAQFYVDAYQIQGRGLSATNLDNYFTASSIEAHRGTRLHDLYLQQTLAGGGLSVRLGQIAGDDEFAISQYGAPFVNATFGWPGLPSNDIIPTGGPVYPFAAPGVRVRYMPAGAWSAMTGLFTANPAGPATSGNRNVNPQLRDPGGTSFTLNGDLLAITEIAYSVAPDQNASGLPATYKLGAWYDSGKFPDEGKGENGLSLASPASNGIPRTHVNDFSIYAVVDQMIWRRPGSAGLGLAGFLRAMAAPDDRNLFSYYVDGGLNLLGPFPGHDHDIAGIAFAYGAISADLQDMEHEKSALAGGGLPVHDYEAVIELTYQAQVAPWWTLQPDLQYVLHPDAGGANPLDSAQRIKDAAVVGLRSTVAF